MELDRKNFPRLNDYFEAVDQAIGNVEDFDGLTSSALTKPELEAQKKQYQMVDKLVDKISKRRYRARHKK